MYFYTQHIPGGRSGHWLLYGGMEGAGWDMCGEGVKHKASGPITHTGTGNSLCQLQAEVTGLNFCRGAKLLENTIEITSLPKSGAGGGWLLWGLPPGPFQVTCPLGMLGVTVTHSLVSPEVRTVLLHLLRVPLSPSCQKLRTCSSECLMLYSRDVNSTVSLK